MDVQAYMAERTPLVDERLDALLPAPTVEPVALHRAMRHLVFPGGKRLRPLLAMAGAEAVGAAPSVAIPVATAVELIHTYSLIHDDLPCMDDDVLRRGRPTVHVKFGEAVAVLAGDALLTLAFQSLAGGAGADSVRALLVARDLAVAAGAAGLVGGQVDDLAFDSTAPEARVIEDIHGRKTAALMTVAIVGGARLGGADEALLERLERFGRALGVAFQIADDLLDEQEDTGCSLLRVSDVEVARQRAESLLSEALELVEGLGERAEPLRELARFAVRRRI